MHEYLWSGRRKQAIALGDDTQDAGANEKVRKDRDSKYSQHVDSYDTDIGMIPENYQYLFVSCSEKPMIWIDIIMV